jgi:hypothetical protein
MLGHFFMSHVQCFLIFLFSVTHTYGQSWSIKGQVVNTQTSNYLIGCSVYNVTKQMGTVTNEEGRFKITVERGDLIQFTYLGMGVQQQYILDDKELLIEMSYQTRRMKPVTITAEVAAKKSVLYNPKYDSRGAVFLEPVRRSAKDYKKMSGIGTSSDPNNPGVVMSPISFFYYSNKKVQRRLNALLDINKLDASNQKYTLDFISLVTKVEDVAELKDIKAHCYFPHDEVLNSTFYELGLKLKDCYIDFLEVKKYKPAVDSIPREE